MVPTIASSGASFKGAGSYYLNDKDAQTRDRVAWTHTENLLTDNPDKALGWMAYTAMHSNDLKRQSGVKLTGRKLEKPVFVFSVAWHPEQEPDQEHMLATAQSAVEKLGLKDYQALYVCHQDEPQAHVHVIVNRVHPEHGKAAALTSSKRRLASWALDYEREHGKIYCQQREENAKLREQKKPYRYQDPVIVKAWETSDNGQSFKAALEEEGYQLAQGRKRMVVVDKWGKVQNPLRHLDLRVKAFRERCGDLDEKTLPDAQVLQQEAKKRLREAYHAERAETFDRDAANMKWEQSVIDAAIEAEKTKSGKRGQSERKGGSRSGTGGQGSPPPSPSFAEELDVIQAREREENRRRDALQKELDEFYEIEKLQKELQEARRTLSKTGLLGRVTGRRAALETRVEELQLSLGDIQQRKGEAMAALERKIEQERAREEARQEKSPAPRPQRESGREASQDRQPDRGHDLGR